MDLRTSNAFLQEGMTIWIFIESGTLCTTLGVYSKPTTYVQSAQEPKVWPWGALLQELTPCLLEVILDS